MDGRSTEYGVYSRILLNLTPLLILRFHEGIKRGMKRFSNLTYILSLDSLVHGCECMDLLMQI